MLRFLSSSRDKGKKVITTRAFLGKGSAFLLSLAALVQLGENSENCIVRAKGKAGKDDWTKKSGVVSLPGGP